MNRIFVTIDANGYIIDQNEFGFATEDEAAAFIIPDGYTELDYNPNDYMPSDGIFETVDPVNLDELFFDPDIVEIKKILKFNTNKKQFEYVSKVIRNSDIHE
jgi:hypothetical protein